MEEWRNWLEGSVHSFMVYTDYKNLEYLRIAKRLNLRQARWSLLFTRLKFLHCSHTFSVRPGFSAPLLPWNTSTRDFPAVDEWFKRSERFWEEAHQHLEWVTHRNKSLGDRHRGETPSFHPGDCVWLVSAWMQKTKCPKPNPAGGGSVTSAPESLPNSTMPHFLQTWLLPTKLSCAHSPDY